MGIVTTLDGGLDGYTAVGNWIDGVGSLVCSAPNPPIVASSLGLIFDFALIPAISAAGTLRLYTAVGSAIGASTIRAKLVPQIAPADYSSLLLPGFRSEILIAEGAYEGGTPGAATTLVLGTTTNPANQATINASMAQLATILANVGWTRRLALTIDSPTILACYFEEQETLGGQPPSFEYILANSTPGYSARLRTRPAIRARVRSGREGT